MRSVLVAMIVAAAPLMCAAASTTAKVEQGVLQGTREAGLTVFKGIPFAVPPVGELRWRPPQPAAKWNGVRPADKFAPQCEQGGMGGPNAGAPPAISEDCLYLNVWTPAKSASARIPVLV
jgi:para-nitrobenzyl esterase